MRRSVGLTASLLALLACEAGFAQNTLSDGGSTLFLDSTSLGNYASQVDCVAAAQARQIATTTSYQCREDLSVSPTPPPTQSGSIFGLEWPGTGLVRRMLHWPNVVANGLPQYDATYIFRVYPKGPKTDPKPHYWTTFFWGNNGAFLWGSPACYSFYGAHPYPFDGLSASTGQNWEVSVNCNDYSFVQPNGGRQVEWNRWHTQAFRAFKNADGTAQHEFYFDLPDTSKVITWVSYPSEGPKFGANLPPFPALVVGQAPDENGPTAALSGNSWGGYSGWEEFKGVIRGIQVYNGTLSIADILNEIVTPQSSATGNSRAWYINLNPKPSDVSDKKIGGTPHNPQWDSRGTTALEWTQ